MKHDDQDSGVFSVPEGDEEITAEERSRVVAGRYEIVDRIGEGGMGQVLLVRHRRLGKSFALKLMKAEMSLSDAAREMFDREARLASGVSHANVVSVVDFGDDPDWGLFIVMELLEGTMLSTRLQDAGRISVEAACNITQQLAGALSAVHESGIVHGDLKPANVICIAAEEADPAGWHVKLLDFGVARHAAAAAGRDETVEGTPEYIAPERMQGELPQPSNDIYSLGVVLYELLTGSTPFSGDVESIMQQKLNQLPEPAGARRGQVLDDALVQIVDRAIAIDPAERFSSMSELADALRAYTETVGHRERESLRRLENTREDAAAAAFDALSVPAAGINVDGTIVIANAAMARVLMEVTPQAIEGTNVMSTTLAALLPSLREDLRLVMMEGREVRRRINIERPGSPNSTLRLSLSPSSGACGSCVLALYALPRAG